MPQSHNGCAAAWCIIFNAYSDPVTISRTCASRGIVGHSASSFFCSAGETLGSLANACQYFKAALAPGSEPASANAGAIGRTRMVTVKHAARNMSIASQERDWDE